MKAMVTRTGLIVAAAVSVLVGCSEIETALNKGGDTPCREYVKQDPDTKRVTITKFIKEQSNSDHEPPGTQVDAAIVSVDLLCNVQANADTPIERADIAGIFIRK
ncbi:hypothetical protein [Nocardia paucivorans]|uniref:hypothetical protein n=1 Tax=Nocardia paucivorans TaxID=114259 RepID=UPI0002DDF9A6|nr:hypothetical protein [Nocardia paucivorans]